MEFNVSSIDQAGLDPHPTRLPSGVRADTEFAVFLSTHQ
jgi:hypothetical protein